jgi:hypothetical protein
LINPKEGGFMILKFLIPTCGAAPNTIVPTVTAELFNGSSGTAGTCAASGGTAITYDNTFSRLTIAKDILTPG